MDLTYSDAETDFRREARSWLEAHVPSTPLPSGDTREGFELHLAWERELFDARWSVVSWPERFGGRNATLWEWLIFEEEYYRAGGPQRVTQNGIFLLAPAIFEFGTPAQQAEILPAMASGDQLWAQGWSEPGAGSDLASLTSRAHRDEARGGWILNGQKTWTTRGAFCTHMFGLFRSDPASSRHHGLTYFLVPFDADGVSVRGFERLDGDEGFAEVFLDDVFVAESGVLGAPNEGWRVAMSTTGSERGLTLRSPGRFTATFDRLLELARMRGDLHDHEADSVVRSWLDVHAYHLYTLATVTRLVGGEVMGADSSINKLHWSEMDVRLHQVALELLGPAAAIDDPWTRGYMFSLAGPIYAGTNEVQRNIAAERLLGLPRK